MIGVDVWDGSPTQVNAYFRLATNTTYPLLLKGSPIGHVYGIGFEDYVVIDHEGIIQYRRFTFGASNKSKTAQDAIIEALSVLPAKAPEKTAVEADSWGRIKSTAERY
jgi:hypothetical protein